MTNIKAETGEAADVESVIGNANVETTEERAAAGEPIERAAANESDLTQ